MPTINKRFLLKLVLVLFAFAGALVGAHAVQARRIPAALKAQSERAAENNKPELAIHYLRQYLEFHPDDVDAQVQLADLVAKRNGARGAGELLFLYDKILRLDPARHATRREALALSIRAGRYSDAVVHADELLKEFPKEPGLWQQLGAAQAGANDMKAAKRSYETAITHAPDELLGYQRLAQLVWRGMNDAAAAREALDRMARALPRDAEAHLLRAKFELFAAEESAPGAPAADLARAKADLLRVLELDPENAEASMMLADVMQKARNVPAAHALLRDAASTYPKNLKLVRALSWLELLRGNSAAAVAVLEDGLRADPNGTDLLVPLADLLVQQGDTARTAEIVSRLRARKAPDTQVKYLEARVAMRDQQWVRAAALFDSLRNEARTMPGLEAQANLLLAA